MDAGAVLKQGGYQTYFTGKWHLGEADYALPNAQGYDEMKYVGLYHLDATRMLTQPACPEMRSCRLITIIRRRRSPSS